ncbi:YwqG family protein [Hymenobacter cellulosilyticus]|uniref:DUF1963 domain-containing protein n=1 Tax=Hymenobacter cellulosilyticus TaxID=2932248 RepID=A0A8T9Q5H5_9BACT|nr:DUF1963 domain-containing protein [Hymenobacter cellulosilyticus]UOQ71188.1 DUF1963 domain-containing protein [Hymenobacter cellulosilyticus]
MIPEFLAPFAEQLQRHALPSIKIKATPLHKQGPASAGSKFGGLPFLPQSIAYPRDEKGLPLLLLAQINLAELPATNWLAAAGMLQFYASAQELADMEDAKVLYINPAQLAEEMQQDFSFFPANHYDESPVYCEHSLQFELTTEYGGLEDSRFTIDFGSLNAQDFRKKLPMERKKQFEKFFDSDGHKLGGYATFTQGDPRDYAPEGDNDVQLLQIDIDEQIMFGDSGVAHFFIAPQALQNGEFDKAYFYWDCC